MGLYEDWSPAIKAIGVLELLAAIGLILPAVTGIAPTWLVVTMVAVRSPVSAHPTVGGGSLRSSVSSRRIRPRAVGVR
ncbi:hypothetical protein [Streptomyces sp. NPDC060366]|uniref:hypothetical protein n=1 Tax=Streptomyces sp. NPDC060366 TaxID=3347105 RepID=UPI003664E36A